MKPISLTEYARRRGISKVAVSKAIADGRLSSSVVRVNGAPKIADADLADTEWQANTRPRIDQPPPDAPKPARSSSRRTRASTDGDSPATDGELPAGIPRYDVSRAVREYHESRRSCAQADVAEFERDKMNDTLVPVEEARAYIIDRFTVVKSRLLGVPSRVAQQLPHLASEVEPVVDRLIREVLEELAAEDDDGDGEEDGEAA